MKYLMLLASPWKHAMENVFELDKNTIKPIERENKSFSVTVANVNKRVKTEIQALIALGPTKIPLTLSTVR